jgi:hypothetical protein
MLARVRSYEIPALVELTVWMSTYLNNKLYLQLAAPPSSPGMYFNDDDVLQRRFREMKQYEEAKLRINLRFLADRRTLVALLVIFFALSCDRPSWTRPSSVLHGLFSRAALKGPVDVESLIGLEAGARPVRDVGGGDVRDARRI